MTVTPYPREALPVDTALLEDWNRRNTLARASYRNDPTALGDLLNTPCSQCRANRHGDCRRLVRLSRLERKPCGCLELGHPRQGGAA